MTPPTNHPNIHFATISSFGDEWNCFDQQKLSSEELERIFHDYFSIFPWDLLPPNAQGFDMGCGSGRWARLVAPRVGTLHCIDPSSALLVARQTLSGHSNVHFHHTSVSASGLERNSQDFGYSLGVLHHVPDTLEAIRSCSELLKPGAPFLLYLYYAFDNRPRWFQLLWRLSNLFRQCIIHLPPTAKQFTTDLIALFVYLPFARISLCLEKAGFSVNNFPLSYYRSCSFYTMRTDSRDRFGTPLEHRFTRVQIQQMCYDAGFVDLHFSSTAPFWCCVAFKGSL